MLIFKIMHHQIQCKMNSNISIKETMTACMSFIQKCIKMQCSKTEQQEVVKSKKYISIYAMKSM